MCLVFVPQIQVAGFVERKPGTLGGNQSTPIVAAAENSFYIWYLTSLSVDCEVILCVFFHPLLLTQHKTLTPMTTTGMTHTTTPIAIAQVGVCDTESFAGNREMIHSSQSLIHPICSSPGWGGGEEGHESNRMVVWFICPPPVPQVMTVPFRLPCAGQVMLEVMTSPLILVCSNVRLHVYIVVGSICHVQRRDSSHATSIPDLNIRVICCACDCDVPGSRANHTHWWDDCMFWR